MPADGAPAAGSDGARVFRDSYTPPAYMVEAVDLTFELATPVTAVRSVLSIRRLAAAPGAPLVLDGVRLRLRSLRLDGVELAADRYRLDAHGLTILDPPDACEIETVVEIEPEDNPGLEGLNHADGRFFTHCEPEGFRRITFFIDRPDVMARYRCTLVADPAAYPVLLSNGHLESDEALPDGRRQVRWSDPHPKATYLFALVAGPFGALRDSFTTASGRVVALTVFAEPEDLERCRFGLDALKAVMAWDERAFRREYDLDVLNVAVIRSYPGGAMENKGLNLYSSEMFLASPATSTDETLRWVRAVIAHEYLHNWSGNRVGCRDWFQLSLKEGLTIFRQQRYLAEIEGEAMARIGDLERLRNIQFLEEDGGTAHAVRPASYLTVSNLYSATVYEKGAEYVRMMKTLVGDPAFERAVQAFFERHDGQAATIEQLVATVEQVSGCDLGPFRDWYDLVGPVRVSARGVHDAAARRYTLSLRQARADGGAPLPIPMRLGLVGSGGAEIPLRLIGERHPVGSERVLTFARASEAFVFEDVAEPPAPSLFRGYSAPIRLDLDLDAVALRRLAGEDVDAVSRWDAAQLLAERAILAGAAGEATPDAAQWLELFGALLEEARCTGDPRLPSRMLQLPGLRRVGQRQAELDPTRTYLARRALAAAAADRFRSVLRQARDRLAADASEDMDARRLRNLCLGYLMAAPAPEDIESCWTQWRAAAGFEDSSAALRLLLAAGGDTREGAASEAFEAWRGGPSLLDLWFILQAGSEAEDCAAVMARLVRRPDFDLSNATRVKATFDAFTQNPIGLHAPDGAGYDLVGWLVMELSRSNARLAARFLKRLDGWRRLEPARRSKVAQVLEQVRAIAGLPDELIEVVESSLAEPGA